MNARQTILNPLMDTRGIHQRISVMRILVTEKSQNDEFRQLISVFSKIVKMTDKFYPTGNKEKQHRGKPP